MKTGMTRPIDDLGRVVILKEIRTSLEIPNGTYMEFSVDGGKIILEKAVKGCVFCGDPEAAKDTFMGKPICAACKLGLRRAMSK
jgi:transcriptional pleiotropic regulator of transition state genes